MESTDPDSLERAFEQKTALIKKVLEDLKDVAEKKILMKVLELEQANRHLSRPRIAEPLKRYVEQEVR